MGPLQVLPSRVRVELGVLVMKEYYTLLGCLRLTHEHQMKFSIIFRTLFMWGCLLFAENEVSVFLPPLTGYIYIYIYIYILLPKKTKKAELRLSRR